MSSAPANTSSSQQYASMEIPYDDTLPNQPWSATCVCRRTFMQPNSHALHIKTCLEFKRRLGKRVQEARAIRQRRRVETDGPSDVQDVEAPANSVRKRRRPRWLDEGDLDVDISENLVLSTAQTELSSAAPVVSYSVPQDDENPNELDDPAKMGRGFRTKKPTYKVQQRIDCMPAPPRPMTLPPSPPNTVSSDTAIPTPLSSSDRNDAQKGNPNVPRSLPQPEITDTRPNVFGLYKRYHRSPNDDLPHDPDHSTGVDDFREQEILPPGIDPSTSPDAPSAASLYPFPNRSSFCLGRWFWSDEHEKSHESFQQLLDIVGDDNFQPADVRTANWAGIDRALAKSQYEDDGMDPRLVDDGISWVHQSITINVPFGQRMDYTGTRNFTIKDFYHRPLVPLIKAKLESSTAQDAFHTLGHELRWKPGEGKQDVRVYGEAYNSAAFLQAYDDLQNSPREKDCDLPRHVVGLMFASDATMLAQFGTAKLWPLYLFFANDSKYRRAKPSERLFEQVAYFEKLPDDFKEFITLHSGKDTASPALLTHCGRELFHEQWKAILDDDFIEAYCHGIVVTCYDKRRRRFYPRIFTYSADYPEKVLIATIKSLGTYPCPRCKIQMKDVPKLGMKNDRKIRIQTARTDDASRRLQVKDARALIFESHLVVDSARVQARLGTGSMIPIDNAFSNRLSEFGFDLFPMLAVDILHEVELGVWKALFTQILRLLEATDKASIDKLDNRYRATPTFGRDTIRRFTSNVSELKKLAARDYEDLLQCAIPALEGLLPPPHDQRLIKLLFTFAHWHGLAKLRLHTDHTLAMLDDTTTNLGDKMRVFVNKTCAEIETKELQREYAARKRRETMRKQIIVNGNKRRKTAHSRRTEESSSVDKPNTEAGSNESESGSDSRKTKTLNLNTYKFHSLGDVVASIKLFGTTDSYSTQMPERYHRYPKIHYKRTSKKAVSKQLSRIQMRQLRIRRLQKQLFPSKDEGFVDENTHTAPYFIGKSQNQPVSLPNFIQTKGDDPAVKGFIGKLREHLLPRIYRALLEEAECEPDDHSVAIQILKPLVDCNSPSPSNPGDDPISSNSDRPNHREDTDRDQDYEADANQIFFHSERIYKHDIFHVNYTTYDVRRETDILNPKTSRCNVMCLRSQIEDDKSPDSVHRFIYARILGVYHANVIYRGRGTLDLRKRRFDFLSVRWYDHVEATTSNSSLDRLRFPPVNNTCNSIGFLDPADVMRGAFIVPRFSCGQVYSSVDPTAGKIFSKYAHDQEDWNEYFIIRFVDRDMLMRNLWGHGVGHRYAHADAPQALLNANSFELDQDLSMNDDCNETEPYDAGERASESESDDLGSDMEESWQSDASYDSETEEDVQEPESDSDSVASG